MLKLARSVISREWVRRPLWDSARLMGRVWAQQSLCQSSLRRRRAGLEWGLRRLLLRLSREWSRRSRRAGLLLSAVGFSFADSGVSEEEMAAAGQMEGEPGKGHRVEAGPAFPGAGPEGPWELLLTTPNFRMWQRPVAGMEAVGLYEYYCTGTYANISAESFYVAQMDLEYRKQWDSYAINVDVVERDEERSSEVVRWLTHCPYPMYPREYLFTRRWEFRPEQMVLISKGCEHPAHPTDPTNVRVGHYRTTMVIRPHSGGPAAPGLDFVMVYRADPMSRVPSVAYKWMIQQGIPGFLAQVAAAAAKLGPDERRQKLSRYAPGDFAAAAPAVAPVGGVDGPW